MSNKYRYRSPRRTMPGVPLPDQMTQAVEANLFRLHRDRAFGSDLTLYVNDTALWTFDVASNDEDLIVTDDVNSKTRLTVKLDSDTNPKVGVGVTSPTAAIHLPAGTTAASSAPLKLTSGTNLTATETGAMEYNGTHLEFTRNTAREALVMTTTPGSGDDTKAITWSNSTSTWVYTTMSGGGSGSFPLGGATLTDPVDGDFSWNNQGGASVTVNSDGSIYLAAPGGGSGTNERVRFKTAPSAPYTLTVYLDPILANKPFHAASILFRETGGKMHEFGWIQDAGHIGLRSTKFTNSTTFSADYQLTRMPTYYPWLRIKDDNTNRICYYSIDGNTWIQFHSIGRTDFLTATQIGFSVSAENSGTPNLDAGLLLSSWVQT